ncbi:MAG: lipopolysaccharide transport periplasmic protein LptA [Luminiphilus sp.]|nr:lipopolysaccharide transport periplasmic protein LptA [Luminiphilus sp.]
MLNKQRAWSTALAVGVLACFGTSNLWALPEDRSQSIRITADSAVRDERAGETRYEGSVELTQGSLRILADSLTLQHRGNETQLITATGSPASLQQTPTVDDPPVRATADMIEYDQGADTVTLTENARIEQDGAIVTGAVINYVLGERRVTATGATEAKDSGSQRVEMVIPPGAMERSGGSEN